MFDLKNAVIDFICVSFTCYYYCSLIFFFCFLFLLLSFVFPFGLFNGYLLFFVSVFSSSFTKPNYTSISILLFKALSVGLRESLSETTEVLFSVDFMLYT